MSISPENKKVFYLNNFDTDYYLTKIEVGENKIKMSRIKSRFYRRKIETRTYVVDIVDNSNIKNALICYRRYNFEYEMKRRERIHKNRKKIEKILFVSMFIGGIAIVLL
jgi:hypothetical protein